MKENYKGKFTPTSNSKSKARRKIRWKRKIQRFMKNKYCMAATYILICFMFSLVGRGYQAGLDKVKYEEMLAAEIAEVSAGYEATILQLNDAHDEQVMQMRIEYENLTPEELLKQEAEYIAKVLYGTARNHNERDQRTLVWCILNRVDSVGYPDTVKEVCQQASQWISYSDDNPIMNDLYDLAMAELNTWHSNYRPVSKDYVFMSWSSNQISLRDTYEKKTNTRYWQAG